MLNRILPALLLGGALVLTGAVLSPSDLARAQSGPATAVVTRSDPTSEQIYAAASAGHLAEARSMIEQVLRDYPANGKAHYVAAEVFARSGDLARAREELSAAQSLSPGLPFANATSITQLEQQLASGRLSAVPAHRGISWGAVVLAIAVVALIFALLRRRAAVMRPYGVGQPGVYPGANPYGPYPNVGPYGGGMPPAMGGGSGLMGNLATGLAVGAGVAAGEALVGRALGGGLGAGLGGGLGGSMPPGAGGPLSDAGAAPNADMGGQDFGLNDGSSWDGGGGGGGGDWGTSGGDWGGDAGGGDMGGGDMGGGGDWT